MLSGFYRSRRFLEGLRKAEPGGSYWYRSRLDPLTQEEYEILCRRDEEMWKKERTNRP